jgi:CRISPR-associated protein Cas1
VEAHTAYERYWPPSDPKDWHQIRPRTSANGKVGVNRHASHPVNAMLNYAYAVLESHVRMEIVSQGYDPTIGYLHSHQKDRAALVFDLMEPLRPIVDLSIIEFVQSQTFQRTDFTIRNDGVCRLNPDMVRHVVSLLAIVLSLQGDVRQFVA